MPDTALEHRKSDEQHCPFCHALLLRGGLRCWLCEAKVQPVAAHDAAAPPAVSQVVRPERVGSYSLASLMMFMTLVCIVLGVSTLWPGVGIPLGAIVLVVWIRTAAVARWRAARGLAVSRAERTQLFLASFGVTVALLAVSCLAGCAAFVAACFGGWVAFLPFDAKNERMGVILGLVVSAVLFSAMMVPVLRRVTKLVRRRWRRDIGEPDDPMADSK